MTQILQQLRFTPDEPPAGLGAHPTPEQGQQRSALGLERVLGDVVLVHGADAVCADCPHSSGVVGTAGHVLGHIGGHAVDPVAARGTGALHLI